MSLVSVLIPTYNCAAIDRTIEAVFNQDYKGAVEVIVVGLDGLNLVKPRKGLAFIDTKVRKNPAQARNACVKHARGSVFVFLDADCVPKKDWLGNLLASKQEIVMGAIDFSSDGFWNFCDNFVHFYGSHFSMKAVECNYLSSYNFKIPARIARKFEFNESLETTEDEEFFFRLKKAGHRLFFEPKAVVNHFPNRSGLLSLLKHSMMWGHGAIVIRKRFKEYSFLPFPFGNKIARLVFSPLIALLVSVRIYLHPQFLKHFYLFPIVFACKMAWVIGSLRKIDIGYESFAEYDVEN